ncbi:MAG: ABC transporter ATP-binding protein [Phycisphaerales bacterium]|nr:ABC transporter ATP-binding protein [Phycisphaerales bacterium]
MTLRAEAVDFAYGDRRVLRAVSAEAAPGSLTVLAGPNGCGKSTLLRLLLGLLRPGAGRITVDGMDVHRLPARARARRIAYIAQRPTLAFPFTVRQVVGMGRFTESAGPRVDRVLASVGLADRAGDAFGVLSAGQQQRASLGRALAQIDGVPAPVLLADEPVSAMDPRHAMETLASLRSVAHAGATVVVVLHDLSLAARFADCAVLLRGDGTLAGTGPAQSVLAPAVLGPVFGVAFERLAGPEGSWLLPARPL